MQNASITEFVEVSGGVNVSPPTQLTVEVVTMVQTVTVLSRCRALIVKSVDVNSVKNVGCMCRSLILTSIVVIMKPMVVMYVKRNSVKNVGGT